MASPTVDLLVDGNLVMHDHSASDLGAILDSRYVQVVGDTMTGALTIGVNGTATTTTQTVLTLGANSTNTPSTLFGLSIPFNLETSTTADQTAAVLNVKWANATHASRTSIVQIQSVLNGSLANLFHNYRAPASVGNNIFAGEGAGNFTMSPAGGATSLSSYNVGLGANTLAGLTTGSFNLAVGSGALQANTTGYGNVAMGNNALATNTTANESVAIGTNALIVSNASGNMAIGANALTSNTSGINNVGIGNNALLYNVDGQANMAIGSSALTSNISGAYNTAVGVGALQASLGYFNVGIGLTAGYGITGGSLNVAIGYNTLGALGNGNYSVAIGNQAGQYETATNKLFIDSIDRTNEAGGRANSLIYGVFDGTRANQQLFVNAGRLTVSAGGLTVNEDGNDSDTRMESDGDANMFFLDASANAIGIGTASPTAGAKLDVAGRIYQSEIGNGVFLGEYAGRLDDFSDNRNSAVGYSTLYSNVTGSYNAAFGYQSLYSSTGDYNTAIGYGNLSSVTTGTKNVSLGALVGQNLTEGGSNIFIGFQTGNGITTGNYNTIIGTGVTGLSSSLSNTIILADGQGNQRLYINSSGNVGIGTTGPAYKLDIAQSADSLGIRLAGYDDMAAAFGYLGINSNGDFMIDGTAAKNMAVGTNSGQLYLRTGGSIRIDQDDLIFYDERALQFGTGTDYSIGYNDVSDTLQFVDGSAIGSNVRMVINSTGNVGIGTTNPINKLEVYDTSNITAFTGSNNQGLRITGNTGVDKYSLLQFSGNGQTTPVAQIGAKYTSLGSLLQFGTSNLYSSGITNTAMTIDYSGNVGIGTTAPAGRLHINGTADDQQLIVEAHSSQTANIVEIHNSSSAVLAYISPTGGALFSDKVAFTQTDGNEYIDSLADGYMDYRATTAHRFGDGTNQLVIDADGDLSLEGTAKYERHVQIEAVTTGAVANQPTDVDFFTAGGLQYPTTGAKYAFCQWEIPDDWDGGNVYFEIDWFPDSGATSGTDAVRWTVEYRAIAEGEVINNGTSVTLDNGTGGDTTDYSQYQTKHTRFTLVYNNANQPLTAQDHIYFKISRDTAVANDFGGSVTVTAYEVIYQSKGFPTSN